MLNIKIHTPPSAIFLLLIVLIGIPSYAQQQKTKYLKKGRIQVSASAKFDFSIGHINSNTQYFQINPKVLVGYFVKDRLLPQIGFAYSYEKAEQIKAIGKNTNPLSIENSSVSFAVGLSYYVWKNLFITAQYITSIDIDENNNTHGSIAFGPGYAFFFNKSIAFTPSIIVTLPGHNPSFPESFDVAFNIGFSLFFRK